MRDPFGRTIDYLRISVTDQCNLQCVYCMPKGGVEQIANEEIMTFDEMYFVCEIAASMGIKHIKVTGGEPLLRKGVPEFIGKLKKIEGIETVTLTTNGILLPNHMEHLSEAGVDGINVSLDTLNKEKFKRLTRCGNVDDVLKGIDAVRPYKKIIAKINCVLSGEDWKKDVRDMAEIAKYDRIHVRFIELMPLQQKKIKENLENEVKEVLESLYGVMKSSDQNIGVGPSVYYELSDFKGKIGFISAVSHKFCHRCNRIRLTCDGTLRMCLQSDRSIDLKTPLRKGAKQQEIIQLIKQGLLEKPKEHRFECGYIQTDAMSKIGG